MKKKYLLETLVSFLFIASFCACTSSPKGDYIVSGVLPDASFDGKSLYLVRQDDWKHVDTAVVQGDKFLFDGTVSEPVLCRIAIRPGLSSFLILEGGKIELDFTKSKYPAGTAFNKELTRISQMEDNQMRDFTKGMRQAVKEKKRLAAYREEYMQNLRKQARELFGKHRNDVIGYYLLYSSYMAILEPEERREVIESLSPSLQETSRVQYLLKHLNNQK